MNTLAPPDSRISNPTTQQLTVFAEHMLTGADVTPRFFKGAIPQWTAPEGIYFIETEVPDTWILQRVDGVTESKPKKEFSALSVLDKFHKKEVTNDA